LESLQSDAKRLRMFGQGTDLLMLDIIDNLIEMMLEDETPVRCLGDECARCRR